MSKISIDLNEKFPTLKAAPSVEAVIHWQAPAGKKLEPDSFRKELTQRLPEYPTLQTQQDIQMGMEVPDSSPEFFQRVQWNGFRLQDEQNRHVVQIMQSGVIFSRLEPYERWEIFSAEALRIWQLFVELARPPIIERLGVRHINRIQLESGERPSTYIKMEPYSLSGLNIAPETFFYKDTYEVPGYPYSVHWVRTIQPQQSAPSEHQALILDIDVFTTQLLQLDQDTLTQRLQEMRWLKNKIFFSSITDTARERFRG
ncbi:TIGR04255 family protein [Vacuolonema iberomarrocanum]|uniref:TIGR04255 family protein n=1 Tax=Vacuolonema iberomarrocanum TaxID=3454632 RepID=UPI0019EBCF0F|nr:TIGR04255 family protein [filamentous cyanobacterium LEGE 07170]